MNIVAIIESYGEKTVLAWGGLIVGLMFGFLHNAPNFVCVRLRWSSGITTLVKKFLSGYWPFLAQSSVFSC